MKHYIDAGLSRSRSVIKPGALMVVAYSLMLRPPHQPHRIALSRPRRQGVQTDTPSPILHIVVLDPFGGVACVVVYCQVQLSVAR